MTTARSRATFVSPGALLGGQPLVGIVVEAEVVHTVLSTAVGTEELTDFAEMVGTELLVIDADTVRQGFANEIRWNQAYHRLNRGF